MARGRLLRLEALLEVAMCADDGSQRQVVDMGWREGGGSVMRDEVVSDAVLGHTSDHPDVGCGASAELTGMR